MLKKKHFNPKLKATDEDKDELDEFCFVDENPDLTKLQSTVEHHVEAPVVRVFTSLCEGLR